jgi:hypothetical protein
VTAPTVGPGMPDEQLGPDDDDGTMPANVAELTSAVVGRRIVKAGKDGSRFNIVLDDGTRVVLVDTDDCCAYTELEEFLLHADRIEHVITGVGTTGEFTTWHVFADMGDVLEMKVGWSAGNPFYYGYGFDIAVEPVPGGAS